MPVYVALLQVATWFHWSTLVCSRISPKRSAMKMGCLLFEFIYYKMIVLSVLMKLHSTVLINARHISISKREARRAACSSNMGAVITFIRGTRTLPRANGISVSISLEVQNRWARRKPTPSEYVLWAITRHVEFIMWELSGELIFWYSYLNHLRQFETTYRESINCVFG